MVRNVVNILGAHFNGGSVKTMYQTSSICIHDFAFE